MGGCCRSNCARMVVDAVMERNEIREMELDRGGDGDVGGEDMEV
jgi:hypothetical protein